MKTVFVDVDTQLDFLVPAGALYAPGAEIIAANLKQLTSLAAKTGSVIVSTVDAQAEDDPEFRDWKPHCVVGTAGQQKLSGTLLDKRYTLTTSSGALDELGVRSAQQIIVEKQHVDCFADPNFSALLQVLGPARFLVYGVVTEVCVLYAARGLLKAGHSVELVEDAIWPLSAAAGQKAMAELSASGAGRTTTERIAAAMRSC
jgi:nicotinamidase/pyrazinamidase